MAATILRKFFDQVDRLGDSRPALRQKRDGKWQEWTWRDYGEQVSLTAEGLRALGVAADSRVAILAANCPEWLFADVAAMCLGAAGVGAYPTDLPDKIHYLVEHCQAGVLVVDTPAQLAKTDGWRDELATLEAVVIIEPGSDTELGGKVMSWQQLLDKGRQAWEAEPDRVRQQASEIDADQLAMLVYTSGTTGPPKGAMYSHANILYQAGVLRDVLAPEDGPSTISFLPLCHIAERQQGQLVAILSAATVSFAESIEKLKDNLAEVRPTVLLAVPRVWEKFYAAISGKFAQATGFKRVLVNATLSVGKQVAQLRNRGEPLPWWLGFKWRILRSLVIDKLKALLGLDRTQVYISGAAPLAQQIGEFFGALDIDIHEVYGQTECVGVCTINPLHRVRFGTVGPAQEGCEVKLAADGEILVKGPNVFLGYLHDEAATKEAIDEDGWLHTGDVGEFTDEGYLRITDRKKDIIVTAGGKNVAPQNVENRLKTYPSISQVVVIGDKRKYLTALITLDPTALEGLCKAAGVDVEPEDKLAENEAIRRHIQGYVDDLNEGEARYGQIKYFAILSRELTVEDGELTPSLKIKRQVVQQQYAEIIDQLYE